MMFLLFSSSGSGAGSRSTGDSSSQSLVVASAIRFFEYSVWLVDRCLGRVHGDDMVHETHGKHEPVEGNSGDRGGPGAAVDVPSFTRDRAIGLFCGRGK